jgi:hypothetical protein
MFQDVTGKLGNMRKSVEWVVAPPASGSTKIVIQSDHRIAEVDTSTGMAWLSDGKNGHQGFLKLSPVFGATLVNVTDDFLHEVKQAAARYNGQTTIVLV